MIDDPCSQPNLQNQIINHHTQMHQPVPVQNAFNQPSVKLTLDSNPFLFISLPTFILEVLKL